MLYVPYTPLFGKYRITFYEPNQVQFITFYEPNQYKFVTFYEPNHPILTLVPYENEYIHQMPTHIAICVRAADGERIRPVSQVDANPNLADGLVSRERKSSAASSPPLIRRLVHRSLGGGGSLGEGGLRAAACASLGTRSARRVRFPMGREPPQGADTPTFSSSLIPWHHLSHDCTAVIWSENDPTVTP